MRIRLIEIDYPDDPHLNLAIDEAIFIEVMEGNSPPTFRFYRNGNAVILGCFQVAEQEVNMDYVIGNNVKIAKRFTGGGAVYHDMGNINFSIISKDTFEIGMNVQKLFSVMMRGALNSIRELGIDAAIGGLNDISVNGKKVLGSAATIRSNTILFHAAVLVNTNIDALASSLKVPAAKLNPNGARSILDRVTNISAISGKGIDDVKRSLLDGYSKELGFEYYNGKFTLEEEHLIRRLHKEKYLKSEWNLGREFISVRY